MSDLMKNCSRYSKTTAIPDNTYTRQITCDSFSLVCKRKGVLGFLPGI